MTYNIREATTGTFAVGFVLADGTSISSGSAVPYTIEDGTSGHGITVSSGVVTLPAGEWICLFSLETVQNSDHTADIYVDSSIASNFPQIKGFNSGGAQSDLNTTAIPIRSTGSTTVELRVNASASTYSDASDLVIYGVRTS